MQFSPPVSRDRIISAFPKCYNPQACLQMKDDWNVEAKVACQDRTTRLQGYDRFKMSKAVVVGDLNVGKTCLINRWDTAGQEKFKCIASAYYRGAQVIITVFDMADIKTLENTKQWLLEAVRENEPDSCFVFLVGTKRDLLSTEECQRTERDAVKIAAEMNAEFWSVSSKTGENVQEFFFRVAALAFEDAVMKDLESGTTSSTQIGDGSILNDKTLEVTQEKPKKKSCC
nr:ras-related protein Rab-36 isoform X1 [Danio rerio]|eukprot:XP_009303483.1 ras-related protein Rab-36 isoform X1 [Danio rerio]